ncbi:hypothetical protein [Hydrogenophaga sp.]|uniref:hypothetical protein n=1 Tax=Hydrogenophaga sp. TaxID=1904254 RepID=UPI0026370DF6|nr:hypothetical protein [Hydrogenophaga sp.]
MRLAERRQPWGELIALRDDPLELRNLWDDPASLPLRRELMERLARAMLSAADQSPYPGAAA